MSGTKNSLNCRLCSEMHSGNVAAGLKIIHHREGRVNYFDHCQGWIVSIGQLELRCCNNNPFFPLSDSRKDWSMRRGVRYFWKQYKKWAIFLVSLAMVRITKYHLRSRCSRQGALFWIKSHIVIRENSVSALRWKKCCFILEVCNDTIQCWKTA